MMHGIPNFQEEVEFNALSELLMNQLSHYILEEQHSHNYLDPR